MPETIAALQLTPPSECNGSVFVGDVNQFQLNQKVAKKICQHYEWSVESSTADKLLMARPLKKAASAINRLHFKQKTFLCAKRGERLICNIANNQT